MLNRYVLIVGSTNSGNSVFNLSDGLYTMLFRYCDRLKEISIGENSTLTSFPGACFQDCYGLENVIIPISFNAINTIVNNPQKLIPPFTFVLLVLLFSIIYPHFL